MARTAQSQGHGHHRAKPLHQTRLPMRMRSLPLREDGLGEELLFNDNFGLGFLLK